MEFCYNAKNSENKGVHKKMKFAQTLLFSSLCLIVLAACGRIDVRPEPTAPAVIEPALGFAQVDPASLVTTASGLQYADLVVGDGAEATEGSNVSVDYTGWLQSNGEQFDSSLDRGVPFDFTIGANTVISGWEEGVQGMKVGGKRQLIIPPDLGYGSQGVGPIPGNSVLVFEVELLDVQ
jgi:FKBP-type peptidyl-prolyl cis-trans isomerase FkpA